MNEQLIQPNLPATTPRTDFKKARIDEALKRKGVKKVLWIVGIIVILAILIFGGIWYSKVRTRNLPGVFVPDQGREHVTTVNHSPHNSNPPTSGSHFPRPAEWGIYKEELADETLIHNLEHGGIWISYKPEVSEEMRKRLEAFYEKYGRKIIVTPRAKNDSDIALVAWNHLDKFSAAEYSDERVEKFIKAFRNKGPEYVP
jgi:hypothetical protein